VFEHSWKLLSEEERRVLRKLAVFRGGFERQGAKAVADASLPVLAALMDKSFLHQDATGVTPSTNWSGSMRVKNYASLAKRRKRAIVTWRTFWNWPRRPSRNYMGQSRPRGFSGSSGSR